MLAAGGHPGVLTRVDFERGMRRAPPLILLLIATNVAVFCWEMATGALTSTAKVVEAGALTREAVLAGDWWRLCTATFLHGSVEHLLGNCVVLYIVGMGCEHAFGIGGTAAIYVASGLGGSLVSMMFSKGPSVGASGAIFGVVAALIFALYRYQDRFYVRDKRIGIVLGSWAVYQIFTGFLTPYVDNFAHIGGIVGGTLASLLLKPRLLSEVSPSQLERRNV